MRIHIRCLAESNGNYAMRSLTAIQTDDESAQEKNLVGSTDFSESHQKSTGYAEHVIQQQATFSAKAICHPATAKTA